MNYRKFELLATLTVAIAVIATIIATAINYDSKAADLVSQAMIFVGFACGLHWGRNGGVVGFLVATAVSGVAIFGFFETISTSSQVQLFISRTVVMAVMTFIAVELHLRLKYFFAKLENHDLVDDFTNLYNNKYLVKILERHQDECDRYDRNFSLLKITVDKRLFGNLKKKCHEKIIRELGNMIILENIRGSDEAARVEDASFAILLPATNASGAECAAQRMTGKVDGYLGKRGLDTKDRELLTVETLQYPEDAERLDLFKAELKELIEAAVVPDVLPEKMTEGYPDSDRRQQRPSE